MITIAYAAPSSPATAGRPSRRVTLLLLRDLLVDPSVLTGIVLVQLLIERPHRKSPDKRVGATNLDR